MEFFLNAFNIVLVKSIFQLCNLLIRACMYVIFKETKPYKKCKINFSHSKVIHLLTYPIVTSKRFLIYSFKPFSPIQVVKPIVNEIKFYTAIILTVFIYCLSNKFVRYRTALI